MIAVKIWKKTAAPTSDNLELHILVHQQKKTKQKKNWKTIAIAYLWEENYQCK